MSRAYDLEAKVEQYKINGFVVFEGFFPLELIDRVRAAFLPLLSAVVARDSPRLEGEVGSGRGKRDGGNPNRFIVEIPWVEPFSSAEFVENPAVLAFLTRIWGDDDFVLGSYGSFTPLPGSAYQRWHRDCPLVAPHVATSVPATFIPVKIPLVDTCEENGSFEALPCTQYLADPAMESRYDAIIESANVFSPRRINLNKGDLWILDPRTLHRGTPNRSSQPRPELWLNYVRPWFGRQQLELPRSAYERLSDRGKHLVRQSRIVDDAPRGEVAVPSP